MLMQRTRSNPSATRATSAGAQQGVDLLPEPREVPGIERRLDLDRPDPLAPAHSGASLRWRRGSPAHRFGPPVRRRGSAGAALLLGLRARGERRPRLAGATRPGAARAGGAVPGRAPRYAARVRAARVGRREPRSDRGL